MGLPKWYGKTISNFYRKIQDKNISNMQFRIQTQFISQVINNNCRAL